MDILVFCTNHSEYINNASLVESISNNKNQNKLIFDTVGVLNQNEINRLKQSHTVKVVGRGDL
jgi:UDP-N-acetyl-D-mannosaminuronate dehydrogenase